MPGTTDFPTALDTFPDIAATDAENDAGKEHDVVHNNEMAAILALQAKVGIDSSADTASLDYKVAQLDAAIAALGTAATHDVPTSGDAGPTQVVLGNDSRLGGGSLPLTTKGDLLGYTSAPARVPVGTDGQVLTADSSSAAGVKWGAAGGGGGASLLMLDMFGGTDSTIYGSGQKRVVGQRSIDPSATIYGLGPSSTATLYVLLATTDAASAACAELFQMTGTGSPQIIAATTTTTSLSSALVSADVSAAFTDTSPSGIFAVRVWTANPDGTKQAVCYGAWLEIEP